MIRGLPSVLILERQFDHRVQKHDATSKALGDTSIRLCVAPHVGSFIQRRSMSNHWLVLIPGDFANTLFSGGKEKSGVISNSWSAQKSCNRR
jgi:hypothetical protein